MFGKCVKSQVAFILVDGIAYVQAASEMYVGPSIGVKKRKKPEGIKFYPLEVDGCKTQNTGRRN